MKKALTRIRLNFGWKTPFEVAPMRLRVATHAAERMSERNIDEGETPVSICRRLLEELQNASLEEVPFPQERNDYFFYFAQTNEVLVTTFIPVKESSERKIQPVWDMVVETYLSMDKARPVRTESTWAASKQTCLVILPNGSVKVGKEMPYFI